MRNPAGQECRYFFGDYYRGRQREECRLLENAQPKQSWSADLCFSCPVPAITRANACPDLVLHPTVIRPFPFLKRQVRIDSRCNKTNREVDEPKIGCGECHPLPEIFLRDSGGPDPAS